VCGFCQRRNRAHSASIRAKRFRKRRDSRSSSRLVAERLEHYAGERPLFDLHGVEDEIESARAARRFEIRRLPDFDQTEALTTIDVNTGGRFMAAARRNDFQNQP
jgi:Ribonuclease G/E